MTEIFIHKSAAINRKGVFEDGEQTLAFDQEVTNFQSQARLVYDKLALNYRKFHKMDTFCKLGFLTSELTMKAHDGDLNGQDVGVFIANSYSSTDTDINFYNSYANDSESIASPSLFVYTLPNILIGEISIRHKITGEHGFFIGDNFDSELLYLYVKSLFDAKLLRAAIIGRCELVDEEFAANLAYVSTKEKNNGAAMLDAVSFNKFMRP